MGATHKNSADPWTKNTLGWNSNTKRHGGYKRQVRCFLLDRGYPDDKVKMDRVLQAFGKHRQSAAVSCKVICTELWEEFKNFVDNY